MINEIKHITPPNSTPEQIDNSSEKTGPSGLIPELDIRMREDQIRQEQIKYFAETNQEYRPPNI